MRDIPLTNEQMQSYRERWETVALREREELQAASLDEKLRRLCSLFDFARTMEWEPSMREGEQEAREHWNRLRRAWHAR